MMRYVTKILSKQTILSFNYTPCSPKHHVNVKFGLSGCVKQNHMTKADIVARLQRTEAITYAHMIKARTMFGESSQAYLVAQARWEVAYGMLKQCGFSPNTQMRQESKTMDLGVVRW